MPEPEPHHEQRHDGHLGIELSAITIGKVARSKAEDEDRIPAPSNPPTAPKANRPTVSKTVTQES